MGWEVYPEGLHDILLAGPRDYAPAADLHHRERRGLRRPGRRRRAASRDPQRIDYLRDHLAAAHRAIDDGRARSTATSPGRCWTTSSGATATPSDSASSGSTTRRRSALPRTAPSGTATSSPRTPSTTTPTPQPEEDPVHSIRRSSASPHRSLGPDLAAASWSCCRRRGRGPSGRAAGHRRSSPTTPARSLQVDGEDFMVFGMNWGYMPIGENYTYDFWGKPDDFIKAALAREMSLLQDMGVNAIRQYVGIPPRWVAVHLRDLRHLHGHQPPRGPLRLHHRRRVDPVDRLLRPAGCASAVTAEIVALVEEFQGHARHADVAARQREQLRPVTGPPSRSRRCPRASGTPRGPATSTRSSARSSTRSRRVDPTARWPSPTATCSTSTSSPRSARTWTSSAPTSTAASRRATSTRWSRTSWASRSCSPSSAPTPSTPATMREDQVTQARYLHRPVAGDLRAVRRQGPRGQRHRRHHLPVERRLVEVPAGERLDIHDTNASWPNGGYVEDFVEGENNMNEEWWGITAKGSTDAQRPLRGLPARGLLRAARRLPARSRTRPTPTSTTIRDALRRASRPWARVLEARGDTAALRADALSKVRVSGLRMEFETYSTGGKNITTPPDRGRRRRAIRPSWASTTASRSTSTSRPSPART